MSRVLCLILALLAAAAAQSRADGPSLSASQQTQRAIEELNSKSRKRKMEALKRANPEVYRLQKEAQEREDRMRDIVGKLHGGKISEEQARRELHPLVKPLVKSELEGIDNRIERLDQELSFLKRVRKDPELLIRRRIEEIMGRRLPEGMGVRAGR